MTSQIQCLAIITFLSLKRASEVEGQPNTLTTVNIAELESRMLNVRHIVLIHGRAKENIAALLLHCQQGDTWSCKQPQTHGVILDLKHQHE